MRFLKLKYLFPNVLIIMWMFFVIGLYFLLVPGDVYYYLVNNYPWAGVIHKKAMTWFHANYIF